MDGFRRSSFCAASECIEVGSWRKSTLSGYTGNCVEVGHGPAVIGVRDSADLDGTVLEFSAGAWGRFTVSLKRREALGRMARDWEAAGGYEATGGKPPRTR